MADVPKLLNLSSTSTEGKRLKPFIGFSFNGQHSSEFGIIRVSDGSRFNENLLPPMKDDVVEVPGGDGSYYFGTKYQPKPFTIQIAFDELTEVKLTKLKKWLAYKELGQLIFDETPYKYYMAKITQTPQFKYIPFGQRDGDTIYKGEGTLNLTAYYPFAKSRIYNPTLYNFADRAKFDSVDKTTFPWWTEQLFPQGFGVGLTQQQNEIKEETVKIRNGEELEYHTYHCIDMPNEDTSYTTNYQIIIPVWDMDNKNPATPNNVSISYGLNGLTAKAEELIKEQQRLIDAIELEITNIGEEKNKKIEELNTRMADLTRKEEEYKNKFLDASDSEKDNPYAVEKEVLTNGSRTGSFDILEDEIGVIIKDLAEVRKNIKLIFKSIDDANKRLQQANGTLTKAKTQYSKAALYFLKVEKENADNDIITAANGTLKTRQEAYQNALDKVRTIEDEIKGLSQNRQTLQNREFNLSITLKEKQALTKKKQAEIDNLSLLAEKYDTEKSAAKMAKKFASEVMIELAYGDKTSVSYKVTELTEEKITTFYENIVDEKIKTQEAYKAKKQEYSEKVWSQIYTLTINSIPTNSASEWYESDSSYFIILDFARQSVRADILENGIYRTVWERSLTGTSKLPPLEKTEKLITSLYHSYISTPTLEGKNLTNIAQFGELSNDVQRIVLWKDSGPYSVFEEDGKEPYGKWVPTRLGEFRAEYDGFNPYNLYFSNVINYGDEDCDWEIHCPAWYYIGKDDDNNNVVVPYGDEFDYPTDGTILIKLDETRYLKIKLPEEFTSQAKCKIYDSVPSYAAASGDISKLVIDSRTQSVKLIKSSGSIYETAANIIEGDWFKIPRDVRALRMDLWLATGTQGDAPTIFQKRVPELLYQPVYY